jgi:excisionase family DNA binding protein
MSSNIEVQKICEYCGNEFTARKTTSKTCSDRCVKLYYKQRKRAAKIEETTKTTIQIKNKPIEELKAKEFLTVRDAAKLLSCSRQTVYSLINSGKLKAVNIKVKKTIVKRTDLDKLFD